MVSIIIRTFNEEKHIVNLLDAIRTQVHQEHESILVDSGSTDRTLELARPRCDSIIAIESRNFTFGYSLNVGCRAARGEQCVIVSAHAIPTDDGWLEQLIAPFTDDRVAMVYGRHIGSGPTKFSEGVDFERFWGAAETARHPFPYFANNANAAIRTARWREHPFDEYLTGLEDIAWAREMMGRGYRVVYAADAAAHHIHDEAWPQVYQRYRREAVAARRLQLPAPPLASPRPLALLSNIVRDMRIARGEQRRVPLAEILQFRYRQWAGTRDGWYHAQDVDIARDRNQLFFSGATHDQVIIDGPHRARFAQVPAPHVKPSEVLIRVAYTGVCSTDLEVYEGTLGYFRDGRARYPVTPGHEFSGTVVRVGARVEHVRTGDRVIAECVQSCRTCARCADGSYAACADRREVGVMNANGSYATFVVVPAMFVHRIPDGLPLRAAALAEPLAVVLRGLRRLGERAARRSAAVIGAGPIGNLAAQVLARRGVAVTVFNRSLERLAHLPAPITGRADIEGLDQYDTIIEATGSADALRVALRRSRTDAALLLLGFPYGTFEHDFEDVVGNEKVIMGSVGGAQEDFVEALQLLPMLALEPFFQAIFPLAQFERAWEAHRNRQCLKVMLQSDIHGS
ncbi:MAG: alcohol dehydrogenase catalytic domain-containing protein [bacterium]|nr:alcohol dehydrogenase catalytic domain-containing protein [bacterium]